MDASASTTELPLEGAFDQFTIGFDRRDRERVLAIWDSILRGQQWSEGEWVDRFEEAWSGWSRLPAVAFGSWAGGEMSARGEKQKQPADQQSRRDQCADRQCPHALPVHSLFVVPPSGGNPAQSCRLKAELRTKGSLISH